MFAHGLIVGSRRNFPHLSWKTSFPRGILARSSVRDLQPQPECFSLSDTVTEPRRISAISLAQRVSQELGEAPGAVGTNSSLVGYTIRLESQTSKSTRLNFVTNGIALRMLEGGSGAEGKGTAFDEITVSTLKHPSLRFDTNSDTSQHIVVDEVSIICS